MRGVTVTATVAESMLESTSKAMRGRPRPWSKTMTASRRKQCMNVTNSPTPTSTPTRLLTLERQRRRRRRNKWPSSLSCATLSPIVAVSENRIPLNLICTDSDIGNTNSNSIRNVGGYHLTTIRSASMSTRTGTDHQRDGEEKRARMEYERMKNSASRILASRDLLDLLEKDMDANVDLDKVNVNDEKQHKQQSAVRNEVTVALQYWSHPSNRRRVARIMDKDLQKSKNKNNVYNGDNWIDNEEEFTQRGEQLLDWILNSNRIASSSSSPLLRIDPDEAALVNLMESHLLPTAVGTAGITAPNPTNYNANSSSNTTNNPNSNHITDANTSTNATTTIAHRKNLQTWSRAIYRAARVWDKWNAAGHALRDGYAGPTTTAIGCGAALHLWSRLCTLALSSQSLSHSDLISNDWEYWRNIGNKEPSLLELKLEGESSLEMTSPIPSSLRVSSVAEVVDRMETLLAEMEAWSDSDSSLKGVPDEYAYNTIIGTLALCSSVQVPNAARRAEWYLRRMERTEDEDLENNYNGSKNEKEDLPRTAVYADTITYNSVLKAYAYSSSSSSSSSSRDSIPSCTHAHTILQRMKHRYETTKRPNVQPDTISYSTVLHGYANAGRAKEAERVLDEIVTLSRQTGWEGRVKPNLICVNSVIDAWAKSSGADLEHAAVRAHAILDRMEELAALEWFHHNHDTSPSQDHHDTNHQDREDTLLPDTISYSSVISAYARSKREDGAQTAEALLRKSLELYETGTRPNLCPDSVTFNSVLDAWAKHKSNHHKHNNGRGSSSIAETRAEALLEQMHRLEHEGGVGTSTVRPCTISYNILLDLYAKAPKPEKAMALLNKMHDLYQKEGGAGVVKPDLISYNSVLYAWASSTHDDALDKAEGLLRDMEGFCHNHGSTSDATSHIRPDIVSYNTVMGAIMKHAERDRSSNVNNKRDAAERVEAMLRSVEERYRRGESDARPNCMSYNICIDAWSKCGGKEAAQRAERILARMMDNYDGDEDDREGNRGENDNVRPDTVSFTSVIDAISKSGETNAAHRAELLLQQMEHQPNAAPNRITFNSIINCWARSGEPGSARKAEEILLRMEELSRSGGRPDVRPDSVTFSSVINALARSGEKGAAERAESILRRMEELGQAGDSDVKANRYAYGAVVNAWAKSGERDAPERAVGVLQRMEGLYQGGNKEARPNQHIYNAVINTFAKSKRPSKAREANSIFLRMMESYRNGNADAKPSVLTYSTLLNACAYTRGTSEDRAAAFQIARSCMKDLLSGSDNDSRSGESPNNIVFGTFLLACSNLLPASPERDRWISTAFRECIRLGVVDTKVVLNVRRSASPDLVRTLLDGTGLAELGSSVSFESLPEDWRCNVRSHRAPSRRNV